MSPVSGNNVDLRKVTLAHTFKPANLGLWSGAGARVQHSMKNLDYGLRRNDERAKEYIAYLRNRALMAHADPVGVADFFDETDFYSVFFINK